MFAVIDIPDFALQAAMRLNPCKVDEPIVLVNGHQEKSRQLRVVATNASARARIIEEGMSLAQALARAPKLTVLRSSDAAESLATSVLLDVAMTLAPRIECTGPNYCTVDLAGLSLADPVARGRAIHQELLNLGLKARIGYAPTPQLARYVAQSTDTVRMIDNRDDFIDHLPLEHIGISEELFSILRQWGLRYAGELLKIARTDVATRLGTEALAIWDDVSAIAPRPLNIIRAKPHFEESLEFEHPVETLEPLLFMVRRVLESLCMRLSNYHRCANALTLSLMLNAPGIVAHEHTFQLPEPTRDIERIFRMLHAHLEQVRTEAAIVGLKLCIQPSDERSRQHGLFETNLNNPQRLGDTLAELSGIVGTGNCGSPRLCDSHCPDAFTMDALYPTDDTEKALLPDPFPNQVPTLPLRRLRPCAPAEVCTDSDGCPIHIKSRYAAGLIIGTRGPWHSSGGWWEVRSEWIRSEWDIELSKGGLFRIFESNGQWCIEGEYG